MIFLFNLIIKSHVKCVYVTLDHKTSHKGQFFKIEIYTSSESGINKLSIDVWFAMIGQYLDKKIIKIIINIFYTIIYKYHLA